MGRNKKNGLDYFPFDIDLFQDIRIRKLIKYQSGKAVTVYALLLCIIYKDGYYMKWDKELPFIISEQTGFEEAYILEVINSCLKLGLFSNELYTSDGILTSRGIQERYKKICDLCRRNSEISEFSLISSEEKPIYSEEKPVNSAKSTQSKVKESKEKNNIPPTPKSGGAVTSVPDTGDNPETEKEKTWKDDFSIYLDLVRSAYKSICDDPKIMETQQSYYPGVNIKLSLEKACTNFWATDAGWKHKKKSRAKEIDMRMTLINAIDKNKVYYGKNEHRTDLTYIVPD